MTRVWSLRARTALAFALTSMALAAAAIVVVNLGSQQSFADIALPGGPDPTDAPAAGRTQAAEAPGALATAAPVRPGSGGSATIRDLDDRRGTPIVSVVAELQWQWSVVGIGGAGLLAGGTGWLLSRRMLAPIDRIRATADRISASTLHERIGLDGPDDELRRLSRTVDGLLDRLERAFASQRRFVAQASHELRTPLSVQRAVLQVGLADDAHPEERRRARAELLEQNRRTEHLVESLLVLAEAERGLDGRVEDCDLVELAHDVVDALADGARRAGVVVAVHHDGAVAMACEPVLTRQLLHNLVDNAIEYNAVDGHVDVEVRTDRIRVTNTGPLLEPSVAVRLTEPFRRAGATGSPAGDATSSRRHSGLGLSIVAAVATAHDWHLSVEPRGGGGLVVTVELRPGVSSV